MDRKSFKAAIFTSFFLAVAGACCSEAVYWIYPDKPDIRTTSKIITAVFILLYGILCKSRKEWGFGWIMTALVFACIADVVIVSSFPVGAGLFALAHICLIILFYRRIPVSVKTWILWGIISAVLIVLILVLGSEMGSYAYGAAVYAPILLLMVFTAIKQNGLLRTAAFLFFASDLILALYQWKHIHFLLHILYMALFYVALMLFAGACVRNSTEKKI